MGHPTIPITSLPHFLGAFREFLFFLGLLLFIQTSFWENWVCSIKSDYSSQSENWTSIITSQI